MATFPQVAALVGNQAPYVPPGTLVGVRHGEEHTMPRVTHVAKAQQALAAELDNCPV